MRDILLQCSGIVAIVAALALAWVGTSSQEKARVLWEQQRLETDQAKPARPTCVLCLIQLVLARTWVRS